MSRAGQKLARSLRAWGRGSGRAIALAVVPLVAAAGAVLVPASPAFAGTCTDTGVGYLCGSARNSPNSDYPIIGVDQWCAGDSYRTEREDMSCGTLPNYRYAAPGQTIGGTYPIDIDGVRFDANCRTKYSSAGIWADRTGKGSQWAKVTDVDSFYVADKECSPPSGVAAGAVSNSETLIRWNALTLDGGGYDENIVWRVRRNGVVVWTGKILPGQVINSSGQVVSPLSAWRHGFRDRYLSGNTTYQYTVSIYYMLTPAYGNMYEGPRSTTVSATTSPTPPSLPADPPPPTSPPSGPSVPTTLTPTQFADIDGDGRDEIISTWWNGDVYAYRNQGWNGETYAGSNYKLIAGGFMPDTTHFADIDGDGRDEIISIWSNGDVYAYRNQGWNGETYAASNYKLLAQGFGIESTRFADIDGDGRDEIISIWSNGDVYAYYNQGWNGDTYVANNYKLLAQGFSLDDIRTRFGDIDGDGRDEIIDIYGNSDVYAWRNLGWSGTTYDGNVYKLIASGGFLQAAVLFADLDGDGKDELVNNHRAGNVDAYLNVGGWTGTTYDGTNVKTVAGGFTW